MMYQDNVVNIHCRIVGVVIMGVARVHYSEVHLYLYCCWRVGHKNVSVIRNSRVSIVQGLL